MSMGERIRAKLTEAFAPEFLEVLDDSEAHRGHGGWRDGGETHFKVTLRAACFDGQSRVARQRAVNRALAEEFADGVHALEMRVNGTAG